MIVFLVGMPACGKTSIGKRLAKKTKFICIDLDKHISTKENKSVSAIFSEQGDDSFRKLENKYLQEISQTNTNTIISVGGGAPCFHNNMQFMLSQGMVFYLNAATETLFLRLKEDTSRPLLFGLSENEIKEKITSLLKQREPFYLQANYNIIIAHKSDNAIIDEIDLIIQAGL